MSIGTTGLIVLGTTAAVGAGASMIAAGKQADAAKTAAELQLTGTREGLAFQKEQANRAFDLYGKESARFEPFRLAQLRAMGMLEGLADPNNPAYDAERKVGTSAIQKTLSSQGLLRSGAQVGALENLELGLSNKRAQILSALAGTGAGAQSLSAGQNVGGQIMNYGQGVGSSIAQQGAIAGQGALNAGNAAAAGISGVGNAFQGAVGNAFQLALMQKYGMLS